MKIRLNNTNKAYHSLRSLLSSRLLSWNSKMTLYNTIIKPVLLYRSETWSITKQEEHQMQVFKNKVYRTIFGPYFDHQTQSWKRRHNSDIHALSKQPNVVATMNANRLCMMAWSPDESRQEQSHVEDLQQNTISRQTFTMKRLCNRWGLKDWEDLT
ncbi:hypothetical protein M8J77_009073 [Diaphorina citri]|jgi:hypothetical protein|nr:hypothetical protein M8J77_009073 [Diaphorina citri]